MIPFLCDSPPDSASSLAAAIAAGLELYGVKARKTDVEGTFPNLDSVTIDLSGGVFKPDLKSSHRNGARAGRITSSRVVITAIPLLIETLPIEIHAQAREVALVDASTAKGSFLALDSAAEGNIEIAAEIAKLEAFLHAKAVEAASQHGADIRETHLTVQARGDRALTFRMEVIAKFFLLKANVTLSGDARIDDALNLHFSNLEIGGHAMAAGLLSKFARPRLDALQREPIPLGELALGDVKLRNVKVACDEAIRITAEFGNRQTERA